MIVDVTRTRLGRHPSREGSRQIPREWDGRCVPSRGFCSNLSFTEFDAQAGSYLIPRTTADIEGAIESKGDRDAIFEGNSRRILGIEPAVGTLADRAA
jgi:hypothetical protein